jgi:nicotinamidase-related amidase
MLLSAKSSQLLLIDFQERLMPAMFESDLILGNASKLSKAARMLGIPIVLTEQNPDKLGNTVRAIEGPFTETLPKMYFDACEEGLVEILREIGTPKVSPNAKSVPKHLKKEPTLQRPAIVIAGVESHICVLQTALSLLEEEDLEVWVVIDACTSRSERSRDAAYDRLAGAGAELVTAEMVAFEWLGSAEHELFKEVQALFK